MSNYGDRVSASDPFGGTFNVYVPNRFTLFQDNKIAFSILSQKCAALQRRVIQSSENLIKTYNDSACIYEKIPVSLIDLGFQALAFSAD